MLLTLDDFGNRGSFNPNVPYQPVMLGDEILELGLSDPAAAFPDLPSSELALHTANVAMNNVLQQQQYVVYDIATNLGVISPFVNGTMGALQGFDVSASALSAISLAADALATGIGIAGKTLSAVPNIYVQIATVAVQLSLALVQWIVGEATPELVTQRLPASRYIRDVDLDMFNVYIRTITAGRDWTSIFMPRYEGALTMRVDTSHGRDVLTWALGDGDVPRVIWKNIPGPDKTEYEPQGTFERAGGMGMIPGGQQIYGFIQSATTEDPLGPTKNHPTRYDPRCCGTDNPLGGVDCGGGGHNPKVATLNAGTFFPVTAQAAVSIWDFVAQKGAAMFTLDTVALSSAWNAYFNAIWDGVASLYGSGLYIDGPDADDAAGWGCSVWNQSLRDLVRWHTVGMGGEINGFAAWAPMHEGHITDADGEAFSKNSTNHEIILPALGQLKAAQIFYLDQTTMAAYLPIGLNSNDSQGVDANPLAQALVMGAMRDPAIRQRFVAARRRILDGPQKRDVRLDDVLDPVYRQQLQLAGGGTGALGFVAAPPVPAVALPWNPTGGSGLGPQGKVPTGSGDVITPTLWLGGAAALGGLSWFFRDDIRNFVMGLRQRLRR